MYSTAVVLWCCELWCCGAVVLWCCGAVAAGVVQFFYSHFWFLIFSLYTFRILYKKGLLGLLLFFIIFLLPSYIYFFYEVCKMYIK